MVHINVHIVETELHVINDCPLYKLNSHNIQKSHPEVKNNFLAFFKNNDNTESANAKVAEFVYLILQKHTIFNDLYKNNSQDTPHLSSGPCIIL